MKILHTVESYLPARHGMSEVVRQISERLARRGHQVVVATSKDARRDGQPINGVHIEEFAVAGNAVRGFTGEVERYQQFLLASKFDVVTNFAAQQWATDIMLPMLAQIPGKKVFVPTGFSALYYPEYRSYYRSMGEWIREYDHSVFLSNDYRDINFARDCGVTQWSLIPNGADEDEFLAPDVMDIRRKFSIPSDCFLVLHVGAFTGAKGNFDAIEIFSHAHIPDAVLLMVSDNFRAGELHVAGKVQRLKGVLKYAITGISDSMDVLRFLLWRHQRGNKAQSKRIELLALSRQETVAAFKEADVFLFPSNIECSPIVLFECMAAQTPFLTTDAGNAREIIAWSGAGLLLPTRKKGDGFGLSHAEIKGSVAMLEDLYHDPLRRHALAESGFQAWRERFTWEKIAGQYEELYHAKTRGQSC